MGKPFHATNKPGTCLWCGHVLRPWSTHGVGYCANGYFCTLRCASAFAVRMAEIGKRFDPMPNAPTVKRRKRREAPNCPECRRPMGNVTDYMHRVEVFVCRTPGCLYHISQERFTLDGKLAGREIYK